MGEMRCRATVFAPYAAALAASLREAEIIVTEDWRFAGIVTLDNGHKIPLRLPCVPRAPRYECSGCGREVTADHEVHEPGIYPVRCNSCGKVTRAVVLARFLTALS
jgi:hypothetical protein